MRHIAFALLAGALLAASAAPSHAIKYVKGKNGQSITCTWQDCIEHCTKVGGRPGACPAYCSKTINDRKASGECK